MHKFYALALLVFITIGAEAQNRKKRNGGSALAARKVNEDFLNKQFWLGFKAGTNSTKAVVDQSYYILQQEVPSEKKYENFNRFGSQASLEITFYYKRFSVSLQPTYFHSAFEYSNQYEWSDPLNANNRVTLNYNQLQKTDHADIPLIVKYDITTTRLRPFVQAGVFYTFLLNATKSVEVEGTDYASGGTNQFNNEPVMVGAEDLFAKNYWGVLMGAGANYNMGNVRLIFEINYKAGLSLANSVENRYGNDRLSGIGDAFDDFKLQNISVSLGCLFPMRFLGSGFKTLD
jgi:outer membrane protein W